MWFPFVGLRTECTPSFIHLKCREMPFPAFQVVSRKIILGAGHRGLTHARCSARRRPSTDRILEPAWVARTPSPCSRRLRWPTGRPSRASTALAAVLFLRVTLKHLNFESSAFNFESSAFAEKQTFRNASVSNQVSFSSIESRTLFLFGANFLN